MRQKLNTSSTLLILVGIELIGYFLTSKRKGITLFFFSLNNVLYRWLKHNSLSYPQIAKLICMTKGNLESISRLVEWLKSVHVKGRFVGVAMLKAGENLFQRRNKEFDEIVEYLERNGVRREWMGCVLSRCPQLLSYSMEEVEARVGFFLDMGMNEKDFGTMVFGYPRVLGYYSVIEMNEKVALSLFFSPLLIILAVIPNQSRHSCKSVSSSQIYLNIIDYSQLLADMGSI